MVRSRTGLSSSLFMFFALLFSVAVLAQSNMACGDFDAGYGPFDYRNPDHVAKKLPIVEKAHYTKEVENLIRGKSSFDPMTDIAYTLDRFPNHHRALYAMARYMLRTEKRPAPGTRRSPECWFERASRFAPDDGVVKMIEGIYRHRGGDYASSLSSYREALALMPDFGELHYNMGLLYFDMGDYETSAHHAQLAYESGYPLPGLKKKLDSVKMAESLPD